MRCFTRQLIRRRSTGISRWGGPSRRRRPGPPGRWYIREAYLSSPLKAWPGSIQEQMFRWRLYGTGAALGLLLDRFEAENWRERLEDGQFFNEMLAEVVGFGAAYNAKRLAQHTLDHFD